MFVCSLLNRRATRFSSYFHPPQRCSFFLNNNNNNNNSNNNYDKNNKTSRSISNNNNNNNRRMSFKFAGLQLLVSADKQANLDNAAAHIQKAVAEKAQLIVLPECFNCPYSNNSFPTYAEEIPGGPSSTMLIQQAKLHHVYIIGGSIPERDGQRLYNTSLIIGPDGSILAKHRKVHLFDIDIPGKITFKESETLSPGQTFTCFQTEWCQVGVGICYDIRFSDYSQILANKGCKLLCFPGAFNMTTGPAHWELLQRSRAVDNQVYVASVSPARNPDSTYQAWGHSSVVDPWGTVIATTDHTPSIIYADINLARVDEVRSQIPVLKQKRLDIYETPKPRQS